MGIHRKGGGDGGWGPSHGGHTGRGGSHSRWRLPGCVPPLLFLAAVLLAVYIAWRLGA